MGRESEQDSDVQLGQVRSMVEGDIIHILICIPTLKEHVFHFFCDWIVGFPLIQSVTIFSLNQRPEDFHGLQKLNVVNRNKARWLRLSV